MVNLFIAHELDTWSRDLNEKITLDDCMFGAVKLNEVADPNKNRCSRYDIGFEARSLFHCQLMNGVKMLLFLGWATVHQGILVIEEKDILVLSERLADGLNDTAIMEEVKYFVKITKARLISSVFMHVTTFKEIFQNDQTLEKSRRFKIYDRIQNYLTILGLQA